MIGKRIDIAAAWLRAGNVVGIPTETVYGLAGNALDEMAVARIFEVKKRPSFDPLIVHIKGVEEINRFGRNVHPMLLNLANDHMPGPLTILVDKESNIPDLVTSGLNRVALRMPDHLLTRDLLETLDFPLAAPSANPFGYISPTTAKHVEDQLGNQIPYILDGGPCKVGLESTIVGIENERLVVYRKGGLDIQILKQYDSQLKINAHSTSRPSTPGMLISHYAPQTGLRIISDFGQYVSLYNNPAALTFGHTIPAIPQSRQRDLSPSGDVNEAARNLFKYLRELDNISADIILAEHVPEKGLGIAINDRLKRAASN